MRLQPFVHRQCHHTWTNSHQTSLKRPLERTLSLPSCGMRTPCRRQFPSQWWWPTPRQDTRRSPHRVGLSPGDTWPFPRWSRGSNWPRRRCLWIARRPLPIGMTFLHVINRIVTESTWTICVTLRSATQTPKRAAVMAMRNIRIEVVLET